MSEPADREDVKIPSVTLTVVLEGDARILIDADCEADRNALRAWVREIHPGINVILGQVSAAMREKKRAA